MSVQSHLQESKEIKARCGVITLSDTRTLETDTSGRAIAQSLEAAGHLVVEQLIIADDPVTLIELLVKLLARTDIDAILTNGGTGISRRDQTIDALEKTITQPLPGFGELFRQLSYEQIGSAAMLSRATAGIAAGRVIFAMPGSTAAVQLAMQKLILPQLPHLVHELRK